MREGTTCLIYIPLCIYRKKSITLVNQQQGSWILVTFLKQIAKLLQTSTGRRVKRREGRVGINRILQEE